MYLYLSNDKHKKKHEISCIGQGCQDRQLKEYNSKKVRHNMNMIQVEIVILPQKKFIWKSCLAKCCLHTKCRNTWKMKKQPTTTSCAFERLRNEHLLEIRICIQIY